MATARAIIWLSLIVFMFRVSSVVGEIYIPPPNIVDPANPAKNLETDGSLPFIYLEPHDCCFDGSQQLRVTIYAVNRSGKPITVDWNAVITALSLEAIGPGKATPSGARSPRAPVDVQRMRYASLTIDLKDYFEHEGASVYRLSYARPLDDGRIHIAGKMTFVVEDHAAIEKLVETLGAGKREAVSELLKCNPLLISGSMPKTSGWDTQSWDEREMQQLRLAPAYSRAVTRWEEGIAKLTTKNAPAADVQAVEMLIDRLLFLSDNLYAPLHDRAFYQFIRPVEENFQPDERERILLRFARSRDTWVVSQSIGYLMGLECVTRYGKTSAASPPILDLMFAIADGRDKQLAEKAISSLSSFRPEARIVPFLRRKMTDPDPSIALHAAIVSCYSGDWTGLPVLLRCARSDDSDLRLKAIAQLGDSTFRPHASKIIPLLEAEIAQPLSDKHLQRARESLGTYPRP